jgi:uracil-DNA glycosylase
MLELPHIKPLIEFSEAIQGEHPNKQIPLFDPCDGGVAARALFLLEAPGPKAIGSEFISRNNPDPTAKNMFELLQNAKISRSDTLLWNIVPWYVGDNQKIFPVSKEDINLALPYLKDLLGLLPLLKVIVLVGRRAQSAKQGIQQFTNCTILEAYHPSARVFNRWPEKRIQTQTTLLQVFELLKDSNI